MKKIGLIILVVALVLVFFKFHVHVNAGTGSMQTFKGAGITFKVPFESNSVSNGPQGIKYTSDTIKASTDGRSLFINGKDYGHLNAGDVVNFVNPKTILVNGVERKPTT